MRFCSAWALVYIVPCTLSVTVKTLVETDTVAGGSGGGGLGRAATQYMDMPADSPLPVTPT